MRRPRPRRRLYSGERPGARPCRPIRGQKGAAGTAPRRPRPRPRPRRLRKALRGAGWGGQRGCEEGAAGLWGRGTGGPLRVEGRSGSAGVKSGHWCALSGSAVPEPCSYPVTTLLSCHDAPVPSRCSCPIMMLLTITTLLSCHDVLSYRIF